MYEEIMYPSSAEAEMQLIELLSTEGALIDQQQIKYRRRLAKILLNRNMFDEASSEYIQCLQQSRAYNENSHVDTLDIMNDLTGSLLAQKLFHLAMTSFI